jgi:hypothetical protein
MVKYNYWFFKLPYFNRFSGMTVYPNIYVRGDTMHPLVQQHEEVHLIQQGSRLRFWFYFLPVYLLKWGWNVFKYKCLIRKSEFPYFYVSMKAYYAIDWEREAYVLTTPGFLTRIGYPDLDSNPFNTVEKG